MSNEIYGAGEDPWPYKYVINALLFYSMDKKFRINYLVKDFPKVLFHGTEGDWISGNALASISEIYIDICMEYL